MTTTTCAEPADEVRRPYVCVMASQVAMCIGANPHRKLSEAMELMWERASPAGFRAALDRNGVKTDEDLAREVIGASAPVRELVDLTLRAPVGSSDQVARQYDEVARSLAAVPLADDARKLVDDVLKRNLYTAYGNAHERSVLGYVRDVLGVPCRPDPAFHKRRQGACEGAWGPVPWFVGGKIDGVSEDGRVLIEIKNRVNRLFHRVPFYEQVQVQTYLYLLDLERGLLVECLKTSGGDGAGDRAGGAGDREGADRSISREPGGATAVAMPAGVATVGALPVARDRRLWDEDIVPKLDAFVGFLVRLVQDLALQDRYLRSRRRSAMISAHVAAALRRRRAAGGGAAVNDGGVAPGGGAVTSSSAPT